MGGKIDRRDAFKKPGTIVATHLRKLWEARPRRARVATRVSYLDELLPPLNIAVSARRIRLSLQVRGNLLEECTLMSETVLYADASWMSPWVFHVVVALEELGVPYQVETLSLPIVPERRAELQRHALLGKVPCLRDGDVWLTESSAISEYLAECYAPPQHPRILPPTRNERARVRQVMSWLRTSLMALREDRPTSSIFSRPVPKPLSEKAGADAAELIRVAGQLLVPGAASIMAEWSVADSDLALALMRLVANGDGVPQRIVDYALAQWGRASVRKYLGMIPTTH
jgi:glutathione S-transferase